MIIGKIKWETDVKATKQLSNCKDFIVALRSLLGILQDWFVPLFILGNELKTLLKVTANSFMGLLLNY